MTCPDEAALLQFRDGSLPAEQRRDIAAHLGSCEGCLGRLAALAEGASGPTRTLTGAIREEPESHRGAQVFRLARGTSLSRYIVIEELGSGGMGVVYAAYDPELNRKVALKLLRPDRAGSADSGKARTHLLREAQALARLSHSHVVAVHDVGAHEGGVFIAMDLVEGTTLSRWLRDRPRSWREVLDVFLAAGRGLAAAHAAGLVHRDFKPDNVLVSTDGQIRVTDFGLARPVDLTSSELRADSIEELAAASPNLLEDTRTDVVAGTLPYMAPEQIRGSPPDARSDQFSFCVALYEGLYGERPFRGKTLDEMHAAVESGRIAEPATPSRVPARVRRAILRGLRSQPEERHPSLAALLQELEVARGGMSRTRALLGAGAMLVCLVGAGVASRVAFRQEVLCEKEVEKLAAAWSPAHDERVRAAFLATGKPSAASTFERVSATLNDYAARWRALRTEACLAAGGDTSSHAWKTAACLDTRVWQLGAVIQVLEKADAESVKNSQQMVASLEGLDVCKEAPADALRPQPSDALRPRVDAGRRRLVDAQALSDAGQHRESLAVTSALLQEVQSLDYRPLEAEILLLHGRILVSSSRYKEAEEILYRALWAAEAGRDDETVARAWLLITVMMGPHLGRADEANRAVQHARATVERLGPDRFPAIAWELHLRIGDLLAMQAKYDQAYAEYEQSLAFARKAFGPEHPRVATVYNAMGQARSFQRRSAEALALFMKSRELRERAWGPRHYLVGDSLSAIATTQLALGRLEEAYATLQRALDIAKEHWEPEHPTFGHILGTLGGVLLAQGKLEEARDHYARALTTFERSRGRDHPHCATMLQGLGEVAYEAHHYDEAIAYLQDSVARYRRALGADTVRAATSLEMLGLAYLRQGRRSEARKQLEPLLRLREKEHGPDAGSVASSLRALAQLELAVGAPRKALALCERARGIDEKITGPDSTQAAEDLACLAQVQRALGGPAQAVRPGTRQSP